MATLLPSAFQHEIDEFATYALFKEQGSDLEDAAGAATSTEHIIRVMFFKGPELRSRNSDSA